MSGSTESPPASHGWEPGTTLWNPVTMDTHAIAFPDTAKPYKPRTRGHGRPACQVPGCTESVVDCKPYFKRHLVCQVHAVASVVKIDDVEMRFCQQCAKFERLTAFDAANRSCRLRLFRRNIAKQRGLLDKQANGGEAALPQQLRLPAPPPQHAATPAESLAEHVGDQYDPHDPPYSPVADLPQAQRFVGAAGKARGQSARGGGVAPAGGADPVAATSSDGTGRAGGCGSAAAATNTGSPGWSGYRSSPSGQKDTQHCPDADPSSSQRWGAEMLGTDEWRSQATSGPFPSKRTKVAQMGDSKPAAGAGGQVFDGVPSEAYRPQRLLSGDQEESNSEGRTVHGRRAASDLIDSVDAALAPFTLGLRSDLPETQVADASLHPRVHAPGTQDMVIDHPTTTAVPATGLTASEHVAHHTHHQYEQQQHHHQEVLRGSPSTGTTAAAALVASSLPPLPLGSGGWTTSGGGAAVAGASSVVHPPSRTGRLLDDLQRGCVAMEAPGQGGSVLPGGKAGHQGAGQPRLLEQHQHPHPQTSGIEELRPNVAAAMGASTRGTAPGLPLVLQSLSNRPGLTFTERAALESLLGINSGPPSLAGMIESRDLEAQLQDILTDVLRDSGVDVGWLRGGGDGQGAVAASAAAGGAAAGAVAVMSEPCAAVAAARQYLGLSPPHVAGKLTALGAAAGVSDQSVRQSGGSESVAGRNLCLGSPPALFGATTAAGGGTDHYGRGSSNGASGGGGGSRVLISQTGMTAPPALHSPLPPGPEDSVALLKKMWGMSVGGAGGLMPSLSCGVVVRADAGLFGDHLPMRQSAPPRTPFPSDHDFEMRLLQQQQQQEQLSRYQHQQQQLQIMQHRILKEQQRQQQQQQQLQFQHAYSAPCGSVPIYDTGTTTDVQMASLLSPAGSAQPAQRQQVPQRHVDPQQPQLAVPFGSTSSGQTQAMGHMNSMTALLRRQQRQKQQLHQQHLQQQQQLLAQASVAGGNSSVTTTDDTTNDNNNINHTANQVGPALLNNPHAGAMLEGAVLQRAMMSYNTAGHNSQPNAWGGAPAAAAAAGWGSGTTESLLPPYMSTSAPVAGSGFRSAGVSTTTPVSASSAAASLVSSAGPKDFQMAPQDEYCGQYDTVRLSYKFKDCDPYGLDPSTQQLLQQAAAEGSRGAANLLLTSMRPGCVRMVTHATVPTDSASSGSPPVFRSRSREVVEAVRQLAVVNRTEVLLQAGQQEFLALDKTGSEVPCGPDGQGPAAPVLSRASLAAVQFGVRGTIQLYGSGLSCPTLELWGRMQGIHYQLQIHHATGDAYVLAQLPALTQCGLLVMEASTGSDAEVLSDWLAVVVVPSERVAMEINGLMGRLSPTSLRRLLVDLGSLLDVRPILGQPVNGLCPVVISHVMTASSGCSKNTWRSSSIEQELPGCSDLLSGALAGGPGAAAAAGCGSGEGGGFADEDGRSDNGNSVPTETGVLDFGSESCTGTVSTLASFHEGPHSKSTSVSRSHHAAAGGSGGRNANTGGTGGSIRSEVSHTEAAAAGGARVIGGASTSAALSVYLAETWCRNGSGGGSGSVGRLHSVQRLLGCFDTSELLTNGDDETVVTQVLGRQAVVQLLSRAVSVTTFFADRDMIDSALCAVTAISELHRAYPDLLLPELAPRPVPGTPCLMHAVVRSRSLSLVFALAQCDVLGGHVSLAWRGPGGITPLHLVALLGQPHMITGLELVVPAVRHMWHCLQDDSGNTPDSLWTAQQPPLRGVPLPIAAHDPFLRRMCPRCNPPADLLSHPHPHPPSHPHVASTSGSDRGMSQPAANQSDSRQGGGKATTASVSAAQVVSAMVTSEGATSGPMPLRAPGGGATRRIAYVRASEAATAAVPGDGDAVSEALYHSPDGKQPPYEYGLQVEAEKRGLRLPRHVRMQPQTLGAAAAVSGATAAAPSPAAKVQDGRVRGVPVAASATAAAAPAAAAGTLPSDGQGRTHGLGVCGGVVAAINAAGAGTPTPPPVAAAPLAEDEEEERSELPCSADQRPTQNSQRPADCAALDTDVTATGASCTTAATANDATAAVAAPGVPCTSDGGAVRELALAAAGALLLAMVVALVLRLRSGVL